MCWSETHQALEQHIPHADIHAHVKPNWEQPGSLAGKGWRERVLTRPLGPLSSLRFLSLPVSDLPNPRLPAPLEIASFRFLLPVCTHLAPPTRGTGHVTPTSRFCSSRPKTRDQEFSNRPPPPGPGRPSSPLHLPVDSWVYALTSKCKI